MKSEEARWNWDWNRRCGARHNSNPGWLPIRNSIVYSWWAGTCVPSVPGFRFALECADDVNPVRHQERFPQQAPQHLNGLEHRFFFAAAHADDGDLARLLS